MVVALGCYVQTGKEDAQQDSDIDIAIGNNKKKDTVEIVEAYKPLLFHLLRPLHKPLSLHLLYPLHKQIQDGCNQFCSYCIIPFARGRVRSRLPEDICEEIRGLADKGYCEFVLTEILQ